MRKNFFTILFILSVGMMFSQSATLIGRCRFEGKRPDRGSSTSIGGDLNLYHNGSFRQTGSEGSVNIWKGEGDIWIIYHRAEARRKYKFVTNGRIQICDDY